MQGERVSPATLAQRLRDQGCAATGSAAELVVRASGLWSPAAHTLFSDAQREQAVRLLLLGALLSRSLGSDAQKMLDCWCHFVIPHVVGRHA